MALRTTKPAADSSQATGSLPGSTLLRLSSLPEKRSLCSICSVPFQYRGSRKSVWEGSLVHDFSHPYREADEYPELAKLKGRAKAGCQFCGFLRSVIHENTRHWFSIVGQAEEYYQIDVIWPAITLDILDHHDSNGPLIDGASIAGSCSIQVANIPERIIKLMPEPAVLSYIRLSVLINHDFDEFHVSDSLDIRNLQTVQIFLDRCSREHGLCSKAMSTYKPTRLIDVSNNTDTICLVQASERTSQFKYAALSYCWGEAVSGSPMYKTTKSNIQSRFSGFSLSDQPPTIQDAVKTTRCLGIPFIWIDALCIMQGDLDDWEREGLQMDKVYENAYITIASTFTDTVWKSFLSRPVIKTELSLSTQPAALSSPTAPDQIVSSPSAASAICFHYPFTTELSYMEHTHSWWRRAWTLQEQILSTRILYFTREFFYLECLSDQRTESVRYQIPKGLLIKPWGQDPALDAEVSPSSIHDQWYHVVEQYTSRKLTFEKDRLPAIAGLVNRVSKQLVSDQYMFGLFKDDLGRGLLWTTRPNPDRTSPRLRNTLMPSWSWASYIGPVSYSHIKHFQFNPSFKLLASPCAERLVLSTRIIPATTFFPDKELLPSPSFGDRTCPLYNSWIFLHDLGHQRAAKSIQALLIFHRSWDSFPTIQGLLVESTSDYVGNVLPECYRRVGYFKVDCRNLDDKPRNPFASVAIRTITLI